MAHGLAPVGCTVQGAVLRFLSSQDWSQERHANWPVAFRAVVRTLLLCAHRQQQRASHGSGGCEAGLWVLPLPLLHHILTVLAGRRTDWLEQADPPAEAPEEPAAEPAAGAAAA